MENFELIDLIDDLKDKRLNIRISETLYHRLRSLKNNTGLNISDVARRGIYLYLEKHNH